MVDQCTEWLKTMPSFFAKNRGTDRQSGTTLLEIIITVAIMSIGMLGYFTLQFRSMHIATSSATLAQATNAAITYCDMIQAMPYTRSLSSDTFYTGCTTDPGNSVEDLACALPDINEFATSNTAQAALRFEGSYTAQAVLDADPPQVVISVRVRYPAEDGRCPTCVDTNLQQGFKAITMTFVKTATAY